MRMNEQVIGCMMLITSLIVHVVLSFLTGLYSTIYAVDVARVTQSFSDFCKRIDIYGECKQYMVYAWLVSRVGTGTTVPLVFTALSIIAVFVLTRKVLNSWVAGGFAALIYASTPLVLSGIRDQNGLFYTSMLLPLVFLLLYVGLGKGLKSPITICGLVLYALLSLHPAHFILIISFSALLLLMYVRKEDTIYRARTILTLLIAINLSILVASIIGIVEYVHFMVAGIVTAVMSLYISIQKAPTASYRALVAVVVAISSIAIFLFELSIVGIRLDGYFNTVTLWGLAGLLGLPGALFAIRRRASLSEHHVALLVLLLAPVSILSVSTCIPFIAVASTSAAILLRGFYGFIRGDVLSIRTPFSKLVSTGMVALVILASYTGSLLLSPGLSLYNTPLRESTLIAHDGLLALELSRKLTKFEAEIANEIKANVSNGKLLVIAPVDNAHWIASIIAKSNVEVQLLTSPDSGLNSQSLLSRLFVSDEAVAFHMLKNISTILGARDIYVVLVYSYSMREAGDFAYIGVPRETTITYMGRTYPVLVFEAYGDITELPQLITSANKKIEDYMVLMETGTNRMKALLWASRGTNTLISQLVVKALRDQGFKAYNYMIGVELNSTIQYFDLVFARNIEIAKISTTYYGVYTVYYMISIFKFRGDVGDGVT